MSNSIIINNFTTALTTKPVLYFGNKTADPKHTFYDAETNERFLFLPPNIDQTPDAWNAFIKYPNFECSMCNVNVFENALCSLHGLDKIDADQLHFYCNPECHKNRVALDLVYEDQSILIRDADGGIELGQVLDAVSEAFNVSSDTLSLGDFERDDCIGQVLRSDKRTISSQPVVCPGLEAFGRYQGTDKTSDDFIYFDELTSTNVIKVFEPAVKFLCDYFNDKDMPAILGNVNFGAFYVNIRTKSFHLFVGGGMQVSPGGNKYPLCKTMIRLLLSRRAEKYIKTDHVWAPWYNAVKSVKESDQGIFGSDPNALRKLLRQRPVPVVIDLVEQPNKPNEPEQPAAPVEFRQRCIKAASGLPNVTKAYRPQAGKWYGGFKEMVKHLGTLKVPQGELKPIHVVLEDDAHIRLSSKVTLVTGTLEQQRNFLTQVAQWMTAKWTGKKWAKENPVFVDFKRVVDSNGLNDWFNKLNSTEDPLWDLRNRVETALSDPSVCENETYLRRLLDIVGVEHPEEDAEMELDLGLVTENQLRQMLDLVKEPEIGVTSKPKNHEQLRALAQQTVNNTDAAILALRNEMKALNGKVVSENHPVEQFNGVSNAEKYSLDPEVLRKALNVDLDSDDDSSSSYEEEEEEQPSNVRPREMVEVQEEEPQQSKRIRVSPMGRDLSPNEREALCGNVRSTYNMLREVFPDEEDRQLRHDMIGYDGTSKIKW